MAVYFITKNRLISKAVNFHPVSSKWAPKWTIVRRTVSTNRQSTNGAHFNASNGNGGGGRSNSSEGGKSSKFKGKLNKIKTLQKRWSWKAGAGWTILSVLDWWLLAAGGWLSWEGVLLRWTPIGLCIGAALHWHLHNRELMKKGLPRTATQWQMNVYCSLPLRLLSRGWGWMAECQIPTSLRPTIYGAYSTAFGVNMDEAEDPNLKNYRSLSEFFTRGLKEDCRIIDEECIVSPADGKVLHFGLATNSQIEQVKGVSYSLESFLGPPPSWSKSDKSYLDCIKHQPEEETALYQCIIYLAPGDYHRFHSPTVWKPEIRRHFAGELLSVSPRIAQWVPGLFCLNERALYIGKWQHGFFSLTAVGATNVGSVQIYIDEKLKTNKWIGLKVGTHKNYDFDEVKLPSEITLEKGQLLGQFNMGSTIVLIFEAPKTFRFNLEIGQKIKVGEKLGTLISTNENSKGENL